MPSLVGGRKGGHWNENVAVGLGTLIPFFEFFCLTSIVCTDLTAFGLYLRPRSRLSHTDRLSSVNKSIGHHLLPWVPEVFFFLVGGNRIERRIREGESRSGEKKYYVLTE